MNLKQKSVIHKVKGGKMLRLSWQEISGCIHSFQLRGDFFIHPEEGYILIEQALEGVLKEPQLIVETVSNTIHKKQLEVTGFSPEDLAEAICTPHI